MTIPNKRKERARPRCTDRQSLNSEAFLCDTDTAGATQKDARQEDSSFFQFINSDDVAVASNG